MTEKTCSKCNKPFNIPFGDYPYKTCPACREKAREEWRHRFGKGLQYRSPKSLKNDKLLVTMAEIEEYNAKHGTHYTYGKYVSAKEKGWLKYDWSEFEDSKND